MYIAETDIMNSTLDTMWKEHRDYLKRLLIGLSRDIDLTDDILQETYVRARAGMGSYRGGDARAWLAAIAKNTLRGHLRSPGVRNAVRMDEELGDGPSADSGRVLTLIHLREALRELAPSLRTALVMKQYGGFSYIEIAERMDCPVGTAKWRVSAAISKLRAALGVEEAKELVCSESRILDYLYGVLPQDEAEEVKRHIEGCESCRRKAEEMRGVVNALDGIEGDYRQMHILEIDREGFVDMYCNNWGINNGPDREVLQFETEKPFGIDYISVQGEELPFEVSQSETCEQRCTVTMHLPRLWRQGESIESLSVIYRGNRVQFDEGRWRYPFQHMPGGECVYVRVIRLPHGAKLVRADPSPDSIRTNGSTTLTWKRHLAPDELFRTLVEYECHQG